MEEDREGGGWTEREGDRQGGEERDEEAEGGSTEREEDRQGGGHRGRDREKEGEKREGVGQRWKVTNMEGDRGGGT